MHVEWMRSDLHCFVALLSTAFILVTLTSNSLVVILCFFTHGKYNSNQIWIEIRLDNVMPSIGQGMLNLPYRWKAKPQAVLHQLGLKSLQQLDCDCHIFWLLSKQILGMFPFFNLSQKHQIEYWHTLTTCRALPNKGARWRLAQNNYSPTHFHLQIFHSVTSISNMHMNANQMEAVSGKLLHRQTVMLLVRESTAKLYPLQITSKKCKIWNLYFKFFQTQINILHRTLVFIVLLI